MPWTNRQYPVNDRETPSEAVCACCGRISDSHSRLRAARGPYTTCPTRDELTVLGATESDIGIILHRANTLGRPNTNICEDPHELED